MNRATILLLLALIPFTGCVDMNPPLDTVAFVDLERYAGLWYEIARYPNSFEQGCVGTTAEYTINDNGTVRVENTCRLGTLDGNEDKIVGQARVFDAETNAKLKVSFVLIGSLPLFEGDYWILELGDEEDYGYAVVGSPNRNFLWILSRTPTMDEALYEGILSRLPDKQFDPERLILVEQPSPTEQ